jgi:SNF2 family DNA or RNA helicase
MKMDKDIYEKLYPHQRQGVQWMWDAVHLGNATLPAHQRIKGGLLSDDMGLGKTIQVILVLETQFVTSPRSLRSFPLFWTWAKLATF